MILRARDRTRAGRHALADLGVHARALAGAVLGHVDAGAQRKLTAQYVQYVAHRRRARERAEVLCAVAPHVPNQLHARKVLARVYADIGVLLVVLEQYIIEGLMQLYKVVFQYKRFQLAVHQHYVKVLDAAYHRLNLGRVVLGGLKVLAHAVLQILGLAHVYYFALRLHQVTARRIRELLYLYLQLRIHIVSLYARIRSARVYVLL